MINLHEGEKDSGSQISGVSTVKQTCDVNLIWDEFEQACAALPGANRKCTSDSQCDTGLVCHMMNVRYKNELRGNLAWKCRKGPNSKCGGHTECAGWMECIDKKCQGNRKENKGYDYQPSN